MTKRRSRPKYYAGIVRTASNSLLIVNCPGGTLTSAVRFLNDAMYARTKRGQSVASRFNISVASTVTQQIFGPLAFSHFRIAARTYLVMSRLRGYKVDYIEVRSQEMTQRYYNTKLELLSFRKVMDLISESKAYLPFGSL